MGTHSEKSLENMLVQEPERSEIMNKIYRITDPWGINLHTMEGMPLHFGLNDFYTTGETEFWIINDHTNNYCGKFLFVFKDQTCPAHFHKKKHETFYIVRGTVRMKVNGEEKILDQGSIFVMNQNDTHCFTGLTDALLLEVSNASITDDNFFDDNSIGNNGII